MSERPLISIQDACKTCNVSRRTIYNWIKAGRLEYLRTAGGSIRIYADTLWRPGSVPAPTFTPTAHP